MTKETILKKARPNGWLVELLQFAGDPTFYVREYDEEGYPEDPIDFAGRAEAEEYLADRVDQLANTPNWDLQARYDEEHGTDNGFAPWQFRREY